MKNLTRQQKAKIRYNMYRGLGYSVADAQRFRYTDSLDLDGVKLYKGKIVKNKKYRQIELNNYVNMEMTFFRSLPNPSVYTKHGYLANNKLKSNIEYKDRYYNLVGYIQYDNKINDKHLNNDQAWYFANFMINSKYSYKMTKSELLSRADYEVYIQQRQRHRK